MNDEEKRRAAGMTESRFVPSLPPRYFHLEALLGFDISYRIKMAEPRTQGLDAIGKRYSSNMERISSLVYLLPQEVFFSALFSSCVGHALQNNPNILARQAFDVAQQLYAAQLQRHGADDDQHKIKQDYYWACQIISSEHKTCTENVVDGLDALLSTALVSAWSAFEELAKELWTYAVNSHPKIALRNLRSKNQNSRKLDIDQLAEYGFDVRSVMGTILAGRGGYTFMRFYDILDNFRDALGDGAGKALSSHTQLYCTENLRHLYVHRAGVPDEKFKSDFLVERAAVNQHIEGIDRRGRLMIDGRVVRDHIDGCVAASVDLFQFVDTWIAENGPD